MNNRLKGERAEPDWLCRIGERVFLTADNLASGRLDGWREQARREMQFASGDAEFTLLQMPPGSDISREMGVAEDFATFLASAVAEPLHGSFLKSLYGAAGIFQLLNDPIFLDVTLSMKALAGERRVRISLETAADCRAVAATMPNRPKVTEGDLLIELGDTVNIGRIERVTPFLMRDAPGQKLAAIRFPLVPTVKDYLLIGEAIVTSVEARITQHADLPSFHAAHGRKHPDLVSLMALADMDAGAVLDRLTRQSGGAQAVHDPFIDFYFELTASVALENGLFLSGWYRDPDGRLETVLAIDPGLEDFDVTECWSAFEGTGDYGSGDRQITRFAAFLPRSAGTRMPFLAPPVRIVLSSGESHLASADAGRQDLLGKRARILDTIVRRTFTEDMLASIYDPALAPIQQGLNDRQSVRDVKRFGTPSKRAVSLIIPLYRETGFIRSQLMAFSADVFLRENCEVVYVVDDPSIAVEVAGLLEGSAFVYPLDLKLVLLAVNGGYALANNHGVSEALGEALVLMNSDVIPKASGWLEPMLEKLASLPEFSVIGPKLLYADDTLQHAGMYFYRLSIGSWQNFHFWKGYGANFAPANEERSVPAVTGACMMIRKQDYEAVGGFTTDYIVGDYEDSDLCLKLREKGGVPLYMPSVALYHFERQSMPKDEDAVDRGSTVYNRVIHTLRWDERIEAIMANVRDVRHAG